jgi:hypothetical protein
MNRHIRPPTTSTPHFYFMSREDPKFITLHYFPKPHQTECSSSLCLQTLTRIVYNGKKYLKQSFQLHPTASQSCNKILANKHKTVFLFNIQPQPQLSLCTPFCLPSYVPIFQTSDYLMTKDSIQNIGLWKPCGRKLVGRDSLKWKDNIKSHLTEIGCESID